MIRGYKNAKTRKVHETGSPKGFKGLGGARAVRALNLLEAADSIADLPRLASYAVHKLERDRAGQWAMIINGRWRACFTPAKGGGWSDVEITDYH